MSGVSLRYFLIYLELSRRTWMLKSDFDFTLLTEEPRHI